MNMVCIGGGPAGLYFSLLMKRARPESRITVFERKACARAGWGLVLPHAALDTLRTADAASAGAIEAALCRWDSIDIHFRNRCLRSRGHDFGGISRAQLLGILQDRCRELGVACVSGRQVDDPAALALSEKADMVIAADGLNSRVRKRYAAHFRPGFVKGRCRYLWLGVNRPLKRFAFVFVHTAHGWFQAHVYPFAPDRCAFIVETHEHSWRAAGLDTLPLHEAVAWCESVFGEWLEGQQLQAVASSRAGWQQFNPVLCENRVHPLSLEDGRHVPVVLLGDAAHAAHFSVGSGTRMAFEDAIALAGALGVAGRHPAAALHEYGHTRRIACLRIRNAAYHSMRWFEDVARHAQREPEQFAYCLLTRSQRLTHENLRERDPVWLGAYERWLAARLVPDGGYGAQEAAPPPMCLPYQVRGLRLANRVVVSPMAMYSCVNGVPGDFHLVHLGSRALGGAGLVMVEMTAVSARARITPGCPGLWNARQEQAFARIVRFVHAHSPARIGIQLGHAGRKGSTQPGWEGVDLPLPDGNWPLVSASPIAYLPGVSQVPAQMTLAQMKRVKAQFVDAARRAANAGFDWLELHCAHGYLLSSFISPISNQRSDDYGGSLENRLRFPLAVFSAVRAAWPAHLPMSVRISAHDWMAGGTTADDAVEIARRFHEAGADMIDCSSGQVSPDERPRYGRMYQTPFAERIRNAVGVPTIAVGAITNADQVNTIIAAGRADLCALARPHLADAAWTLRETARLGFEGAAWPRQYSAGQRQLHTLFARAGAGTSS